ncbi:MAG: hypothetical protein A3J29_07130 [Acidobacteria bacterium RIFCSPLOWO2_12_FULL_67_14b]|nr:MAG: hypothetical protein A3J29_07130 [Acidobacteria bacterium RIFCSPLOWO2_12_FULL_67_14b]
MFGSSNRSRTSLVPWNENCETCWQEWLARLRSLHRCVLIVKFRLTWCLKDGAATRSLAAFVSMSTLVEQLARLGATLDIDLYSFGPPMREDEG